MTCPNSCIMIHGDEINSNSDSTIRNGVQYSVGNEGIKGKLQTVHSSMNQYEPESSSRQGVQKSPRAPDKTLVYVW
jgi:hypothetical protein